MGEIGRSVLKMDIDINVLAQLTEFIANIGFPIFISLFLLSRMETKVDNIIEALNELTNVIAKEQ